MYLLQISDAKGRHLPGVGRKLTKDWLTWPYRDAFAYAHAAANV